MVEEPCRAHRIHLFSGHHHSRRPAASLGRVDLSSLTVPVHSSSSEVAPFFSTQSEISDILKDIISHPGSCQSSVLSLDVPLAAWAADAFSTRAPRTVASVSLPARRLLALLLANPSVPTLPAPTLRVWHSLLLLLLRALTADHLPATLLLPPLWPTVQPSTAVQYVSLLKSALERRGHLPWQCNLPFLSAATRPVRTAARRCESTSSTPIFMWEIADTVLSLCTSALDDFQLMGLAAVALSAVGGFRPSTILALPISAVRPFDAPDFADTYLISVSQPVDSVVDGQPFGRRPKNVRASALQAERSITLPLGHWTLPLTLGRWLDRRRAHSVGGLLFPSMTRASSSGPPTWLPSQPLSDRSLLSFLDFALRGARRERTWVGLRQGCATELQELNVPLHIAFTIQQRSLQPLLHSHAFYVRPVANSIVQATRSLGSLRLVQHSSGLIFYRADPPSSPRSVVPNSGTPERPALPSPPDRAEPLGRSSGSPPSTPGALSTPPADPDTLSLDCWVCGTHVNRFTDGFLCDFPHCRAGACTRCHTSAAEDLFCPEHSYCYKSKRRRRAARAAS